MAEYFGNVTGLNLFPIKSCHAALVDGAKPETLDVGRTGFEAHSFADRGFVLVEENTEVASGAHFVTQRGWGEKGRTERGKRIRDNLLALVHTNVTADGLEITGPNGFQDVFIPMDRDRKGGNVTVNIFNKILENAIDLGDKSAKSFSELLDRPVRLVEVDPSRPRMLTKYRMPHAANSVAAADGSPLLWVSQASLDFSHDQNDIPRGTVPLIQYRANVESDGSMERPYYEDFSRRIKVGNMVAEVFKACPRCPMPSIDQDTAQHCAGRAVLRGRLGYIETPTERNYVFGQNLNHRYEGPGSTVSIDEPIIVLEGASERNFTLLAA